MHPINYNYRLYVGFSKRMHPIKANYGKLGGSTVRDRPIRSCNCSKYVFLRYLIT